MSLAPRKVLLIGWDAADWGIIHPLLDRGELPSLQQLIEGGVSGNLASIRPMLSPMLWTSIATGQRAHKHGVLGFTEVEAGTHQVQPVSSGSRRVKALWDILGQNGLRSNVVSWFATHPAEPISGACVSDLFAVSGSRSSPLPAGTIHPSRLAKTLADLRVGFDDIDANVLRLFIPELADIDLKVDSRPAVLAQYLVECFSTHAAATWLLEHEPAVLTAVYYRAIDWVSHHFMAYHPPHMQSVLEKDGAIYGEVVNGIYRLHDRMLGRLLQLAGPDTTVVLVSDHGFFHNHLRPKQTPNVAAGIANWHRPIGILAMRGPDLQRDELIHGARLLDITPTILTMFGLSVGRDMDGRVLSEAFKEPPPLEFVESWETVSGDNGAARVRSPLDSEGARMLEQHFAELGYVTLNSDPVAAEAECRRENEWNLARSYLDAGLFREALPLLEELYHSWPERTDYGLQLANCQLQLGLDDEAWDTMQTVLEPEGDSPAALLIRGNIEYRRRNFQASLQLLREAEAADPQLPGLYNQIGLSLLKLNCWGEAEETFRKALGLDGDDPHAHLGVAYSFLRRRRFSEAVEWSLGALGRGFNLPLAHFTLGMALARLEENDRAIQAFETCLRFAPGYSPAHRLLAVLYSRRTGAQQLVRLHRDQGTKSEARLAREQEFRDELRVAVAERNRIRAEAKRLRRLNEIPGASPQAEPPDVTAKALSFLIVSGLPRSGTSLMMQILEAAGLPMMRDDVRRADESNMRGYFEWEEIKKLPNNPYIIEKAHGRVTKVISMLLPSLPRKHSFRVIFMTRDLNEVAASQEKLRRRLGSDVSPDPNIVDRLRQHRERVLALLRESPNVELLEVEYGALLDTPNQVLPWLIEFAGLDPEAEPRMLAVIDPRLRHFETDAV